MRLAPFWRYYGGKFRAAPHYPKPMHSTIIEPFAGAAGYSMRYSDRNVILVEKYPVIAEMWRYLIGASERDILSIPDVESIDELPSWVPDGARSLVGFCFNDATTTPSKSMSRGRRKMRDSGRAYEGWCRKRKELIANQLRLVRHWRVIEGDYSESPDVLATWYIDPPYQGAGKYYKHTLTQAQYADLGAWCQSRSGQVIVCENVGADWLPFQPWKNIKSGPARRVSSEAIWYRECTESDSSATRGAS